MSDQQAMAKAIARRIFEVGDERDDKCQRIAFKGGNYPYSETNLGGLNEDALARVISNYFVDFPIGD